MIINIIAILTFYLIFLFKDNGVVLIQSPVRIRTPCVIIRSPYIPLDKLYIIDETIR